MSLDAALMSGARGEHEPADRCPVGEHELPSGELPGRRIAEPEQRITHRMRHHSFRQSTGDRRDIGRIRTAGDTKAEFGVEFRSGVPGRRQSAGSGRVEIHPE